MRATNRETMASGFYLAGMALLVALTLLVAPGRASVWHVVVSVVVALACWGLTLTGIHVDPLAVDRPYDAKTNGIAAVAGWIGGAISAWAFLGEAQRHLSTLPLVWISLSTGFGTGMAILWGLGVEWRRRRLDRSVVSRQIASRDEIRQRVRERLEVQNRRASFLEYGAQFEEAMAGAGDSRVELDAGQRSQVSNILLVAAETYRALVRMLDKGSLSGIDKIRPFMDRVMDRVRRLTDTKERVTPAELEALRSRIAVFGTRSMAAAGPPTQDTSEVTGTLAASMTAGRRLQVEYVPVPGNFAVRWLQRALGLVSVAGPRPGAFYGVALLLVALLILVLFELPANGVPSSSIVRTFSVPVIVLWILWLWLAQLQGGSILSLLGQVGVSLVAASLALYWWPSAALTWPGIRAPIWAWTLAILTGSLPGLAVGNWLYRRRVPYPPSEVRAGAQESNQIPGVTVLKSMDAWAREWRGELIATAWNRFFEGPVVAWLNGPINELLSRTAPAQASRVGSLVMTLRDLARGNASEPAFLVRAAVAASSLHQLARWQLANQALGEMMGDVEMASCSVDFQQLLEADAASVDDWLTFYGGPLGKKARWPIEILSSRGLYPPRVRDIG